MQPSPDTSDERDKHLIVAGAAQPHEISPDGRLIRKRNRVPVSCIPCRAKRAKCNRALPCARCLESHQADSCRYFNRSVAHQQGARSGTHTGPEPEYANHNFITTGDLSNVNVKSHDHIGAQWNVVFQQLNDAAGNNHVADHRVASGSNTLPVSLLDNQPLRPLHDIITNFLPPRAECDKLLNQYFFAEYGPLPILHEDQFMRIYLGYWAQNQTDISPMWLSVLFSAFATAVIMTPGFPTDTFPQKQKYAFAATQCLLHGGYTKQQPWLIEALIMHLHTEYLSNFEPTRETVLLVPMLVRIAFEAGLHREPNARTPVFQAEIHRRLFIVLRHFDTVIAYQTGLPMNIGNHVIEVNEPRNLYDIDLSESATTLPPARPESDASPMLCFIVKSRVMEIFAKVYEVANAGKPPSPDVIERLHAEAVAVRANIPGALRPKPLSLCAGDSKMIIMSRLNCEFLAQRCVCVLHRRAMAAGDPDASFKCVAAAIVIIETLLDIHSQMLPDGRVAGFNRFFSSTMVNDFFLAAMLLCLAVSLDSKAVTNGLKPNLDTATKNSIHSLLHESHRLSRDMDHSVAAVRRVDHAIGSALKKVTLRNEIQLPISPELSDTQTDGHSTEANSMAVEVPKESPDQGVAMEDIWMDPTLENFFAMPAEVDWSSFDQFLNLPD